MKITLSPTLLVCRCIFGSHNKNGNLSKEVRYQSKKQIPNPKVIPECNPKRNPYKKQLILNKKAILINKPFPLPNPSNYSWNSKINLTSVGIFWNSSHFEILCGGRDKWIRNPLNFVNERKQVNQILCNILPQSLKTIPFSCPGNN